MTFLTSTEFSSLIKNHPFVDHVITYDRKNKESWSSLMNKIQQRHKDTPIQLIIDLHGTLRSLRLKLSLWTIPALTIDKRRWERFFLVKIKNKTLRKWIGEKILKNESQVERVLKDFRTIFFNNEKVFSPNEEGTFLQKTPLTSKLTSQLSSFIVVAPAASFEAKKWPVKKFHEVIEKLLKISSYDIVLLAGKEDTFCAEFNQITSHRFHNLQGKTSLLETQIILSHSSLCIGNDSGLNHIAEAFGIPVITLFGPTTPYFGFKPHGLKSRYFWGEVPCSPCSTTGKKACVQKSLVCMESLSSQLVIEATKDILGLDQKNSV